MAHCSQTSDSARAVGFNHVALEVRDVEEALAFYGRLFDFKLRGKSGTSAFIDLGEQGQRCQLGGATHLKAKALLGPLWVISRH
jgi:catechol 2,3-dioxygenase-like lactoylglutathione lyase family enzyme